MGYARAVSVAMSDTSSIRFQLPGIAELIETSELMVPLYQRSYAWNVDGDEQVREFWADLDRAFANRGEYFLGTVVLSADGEEGRRTIIDGQQRLATATLLLAAIRNCLHDCSSGKAAIVERDYLAKETLASTGKDRRLLLNIDDDDYFEQIVSVGTLGTPDPKVPSQGRIRHAFAYLLDKTRLLSESGGEKLLLDWVMFLKTRARVGVIEVPTEADAYIIFETLNDRGQDLTPADLLKNYLYGRAGTKIDNVRQSWARTLGALELTAADSKFMTYLRHHWSSIHGVTREKDLYGKIKKVVSAKSDVVGFAAQLADEAVMYAALANSGHDYWQTLGSGTRTDVDVLTRLRILPNRPLLLAAVKHFAPSDVQNLLRALVSWSVRQIIVGTVNSGRVEEQYCLAASKIRVGRMENFAHLRSDLLEVIPTDTDFREAFEIARVTKSSSARYYLRVLERQSVGEAEPELVPNADEAELNLEHILPRNAVQSDWPGIETVDDLDTWANRLGNMVLLRKKVNSKIGNRPFAEKKLILATSDLVLTKEVSTQTSWGPEEISQRQKTLARLAVDAWPR
jgi:hypothetical protein